MAVELNINRFFSDRLVMKDHGKVQIDNSFCSKLLRVFSWIYSPKAYTAENRKTVQCFKKYLLHTLGHKRATTLCNRYSINLEEMEREGSPLLSRHVAKIAIGVRDVSIEDINDLIDKAKSGKKWPSKLPADLKKKLESAQTFLDLDANTFAETRKALSEVCKWKIPRITAPLQGGRATEYFARIFFDPFLADRERLQLVEEHHKDNYETFVHNTVVRVIKRELEVGMLIPAPNSADERAQFYYVAGKLITNEGMVSYILVPATKDTQLEPIRLFRGSAFRAGEIDAISTIATDLEENLGSMGHQSSRLYEPIIESLLPTQTIAGHSLGSTHAQYHLANDVQNRVTKGYFFNGPGLPETEVEKFNQRMESSPHHHVHLIVRRAAKDKACLVGKQHIGLNAPENVTVDHLKYHPPSKSVPNATPHVFLWGRARNVFFGIEGGNGILHELHHDRHKDSSEGLRSTLGPPISYLIRKIRNFFRSFVQTRAVIHQGLEMGWVEKGGWHKMHITPDRVPAFIRVMRK